MARLTLIAVTALALSGCLTTGGVREVRTDPAGAFLMIEGFGTCETPCTVKVDRPRQARVSRTGYVTQDITIKPGRGPVTVTLELAAASQDVDAVSLPELD